MFVDAYQASGLRIDRDTQSGFIGAVSNPIYHEWEKRNRIVKDLGAFCEVSINLTWRGDAQRLQSAQMTAGLAASCRWNLS